MNIKQRIAGELAVLKKVVKAAIKNGWTVSLNDGEEWTVKRSRDANEVIDAAMTTDEDYLRFRDADGNNMGAVYFVYGNSPDEVINDYSVSLESFIDALGVS